MPEPQNNFLIFNENNNQGTTLSQGDYLALAYRISGLIPMIADPIAHNKMFRQWSLMCNVIGAMINDKNLDALDTNSSDLKNNLKSTVKGLARDELSTEITTLGNIDTWKESITATPAEINTLDGITASTAELNILDGVTASTTEINYLSGADSNIQQQINAITGVISNPFPAWTAEKVYEVGDICIANTFKSYQYLECVVAGESGTTTPSYVDVGQMITDNEVKWLVCDFRDSAPVGTIKQDLVKRDGWLKLNGATVNVADYPRLVSFLTANSLIQSYTSIVDSTKFKYGDIDNETLLLPDFEGLFIENSVNNTLSKVNAGLPNITGVIGYIHSSALNEGEGDWGVFKYRNYGNNVSTLTSPPTGQKGGYDIEFNASKGNSIYGNSNTVQPPAVKLIPIIKY